jgi:hypothetical protein
MDKKDDKSLVLLRLSLENKFHRKFTDLELREIADSLFYLGRAVNRYRELLKGGHK